jgi:hypothetical protein
MHARMHARACASHVEAAFRPGQALYYQAKADGAAVQPDDLVHAGAILRACGAHHEAACVEGVA